jgi:hypothetical protein
MYSGHPGVKRRCRPYSRHSLSSVGRPCPANCGRCTSRSIEQQRLGVKPRRAWKEAVVRWLAETSEKATHDGDIKKLRWLDAFLGAPMLDEITLDVIDRVKSGRPERVSKSTVNRYLAVVRSILLRARDEWEWIDKVPKVKLFREPPGRERSITVEQAVALLRELPAHQRDVVLFTLATGLRQSGTPTHELQRLGGWRTSVMVERHAHLAPDHLAKAANRLDSLLGGYDLATLEKKQGVSKQR